MDELKNHRHNFGSGLGLKVRLYKDWMATGNVTFSKLQRKSGNDGLEDGFNTPQWMTNISLGNEKVLRNVGFMLTYRWQSAYYWQSFLVNGDVPAYQTLDGQVSYRWSNVILKLGGSNLLNHFYNSYLGGPSVGGFYYTSLTVNL